MSRPAAHCILGAWCTLLLCSGTSLAQSAANESADSAETELAQSIDLPTVLRLAGSSNLDLAIVREAEKEAQAVNEAATLQFFPSIDAGYSFSKHTGLAQNVTGPVVNVERELYGPVAGVTSQVNFGDAIFQKLVARQARSAAGYNVEAQRSDTTLAAAGAYFDLVNAVALESIAREAVGISQGYGLQLQRAGAIGLADKNDELRVNVQTQHGEIALRQAEASVRVAAARLAEVLHLDPGVNLRPKDNVAPQLTLVPPDATLQSLIAQALDSRPELKSSEANIAAADLQRSEALYGPLIPTIGAQAVYGEIRGGVLGEFGPQGTSRDYTLALSWRFGPGGLFDFSRAHVASSRLSRERLKGDQLHDDITRQVVEAYENVHAALDATALGRKGIGLAEQNLKLSEDRKQFGVAAVLEVIQAQQDLTQARTDYMQALTQSATAQYALARAVARIGS
jgi:outer membrane protein TolC